MTSFKVTFKEDKKRGIDVKIQKLELNGTDIETFLNDEFIKLINFKIDKIQEVVENYGS